MKIDSSEELALAFKRLDQIIADGFEGIPALEQEFDLLAHAIEEYEIRMGYFPIRKNPETLPAMIELKRQQKNLKQKDLAALLEIPAGRLSQILSGKRRVTIDLAKKLYERLNISSDFILRTA